MLDGNDREYSVAFAGADDYGGTSHRGCRMDESVASVDSTAVPVRVPRNYCWIPTMDLEVGMVLARPVLSGTGMHASLHLAVGVQVTASTLAQLINKGIECVAVEVNSPPAPEIFAASVDRYEARLREIFGPDPDPHCQALLDALIADGPCSC